MSQEIITKKIKISTSLLLLIGIVNILTLILTFCFALSTGKPPKEYIPLIMIGTLLGYPLLSAILFISFSYFLKKGKKWAWWGAIILLLREAVGGTVYLFSDFWNSITSQLRNIQTYGSDGPFVFYLSLLIIFIVTFISVLLALVFLIQERESYLKSKSI